MQIRFIGNPPPPQLSSPTEIRGVNRGAGSYSNVDSRSD